MEIFINAAGMLKMEGFLFTALAVLNRRKYSVNSGVLRKTKQFTLESIDEYLPWKEEGKRGFYPDSAIKYESDGFFISRVRKKNSDFLEKSNFQARPWKGKMQ